MDELIHAISLDESLRNILCEREDCFIDLTGALCVKEEDGDYDDVIELMTQSELAFDGRFYGQQPKIKQVPETEVRDVILNLKSDRKEEQVNKEAENTEAKQRLQRLLEASLKEKYSDIHLRLDYEKNRTQINGRLDGEFVEMMGDQNLEFGVTVCYYAAVTMGQKQIFSEHSQVDCTFEIETTVYESDSSGKQNRYSKLTKWRMSQIRIDEGTKVTFRSLETGGSSLPKLDALGLTAGHVEAFVTAVNAAQGATLMSGPTGSGKTTTINCALQTIKPTRYIHSLEDPVEFNRPGRNHFATPVNEEFTDPKTKIKTRSFEYLGKVLLRHDTNVLYFGEVRDKGAAAQFMRLATTGQVMVGTIHCNSAISIITTVAEQLGVPVTQLAAPGILKALAHQRLVRTLCPNCKMPFNEAKELAAKHNDQELIDAVKATERIAEQEKQNTSNVYFRRKHSSCKHCAGKGEKGRTAVFEIIIVDAIARDFIRELRLNEWQQHLESMKWPSIADHARAKVLTGVADYRSVLEEVDGMLSEDIDDIYDRMRVKII